MKDLISEFILSSYKLLNDSKNNTHYYHTLIPDDNSPVVVHHTTNQFTYVISGNGSVFLNGDEIPIEPGKEILIEVGTTHRFVAISRELVLFHIHIPESGRTTDRFILEGEDYRRNE